MWSLCSISDQAYELATFNNSLSNKMPDGSKQPGDNLKKLKETD